MTQILLSIVLFLGGCGVLLSIIMAIIKPTKENFIRMIASVLLFSFVYTIIIMYNLNEVYQELNVWLYNLAHGAI
jgi:divalent metal cation (Fe/Co/Zn/Cd) transporter